MIGLVALAAGVACWTTQRIVGGHAVTPESKYPWMVSLALMGSHQCGGMAYRPSLVLTAAHCTIFDDDDWTARFRHYDLTKRARNAFKIGGRRVHPRYNHTANDLNDIAVWRIKGRFDLLPSEYVSLDQDSISYTEGRLLKVIGWGNLSGNQFGNTRLMEVQLPTANLPKCIASLAAEGKVVDPTAMFCAGFPEGGRDACYGDSGGPIFMLKGQSPVLVGIVSWGVGCANPGLPAIFTRLETYTDFIDTTAHILE